MVARDVAEMYLTAIRTAPDSGGTGRSSTCWAASATVRTSASSRSCRSRRVLAITPATLTPSTVRNASLSSRSMTRSL
jgi:hypothetical protein